jgi:hypothetical protein
VVGNRKGEIMPRGILVGVGLYRLASWSLLALHDGQAKSFAGLGVATGLLSGFEGQRHREPDGHAAGKPADVVNSADMPVAGEIGHIEGIVRAEAWYAEAGGYMLAGGGTIIVGKTGKGRPSAGNINHLALGKDAGKVLCEPDGPMIPQSLLCSSLEIFLHFKHPYNPKIFTGCASSDSGGDFMSDRRENRGYVG